jgi:hypothetical protein
MSRVVAALCGGFVLGLIVPLASGQAPDEKSKDRPRQYSKPVGAGGVKFELVAETVWRRPAEVYGVATASIGLRIGNESDKDLTFDLGDTLRVRLKAADGGADLVSGAVPKQFLPNPIKVAAGKSKTVTLPSYLFHTRIGEICLGLDADTGWNWLTRDVLPGKYRLGLYYENKQKDHQAWQGKVQTETLEIQVMAAK